MRFPFLGASHPPPLFELFFVRIFFFPNAFFSAPLHLRGSDSHSHGRHLIPPSREGLPFSSLSPFQFLVVLFFFFFFFFVFFLFFLFVFLFFFFFFFFYVFFFFFVCFFFCFFFYVFFFFFFFFFFCGFSFFFVGPSLNSFRCLLLFLLLRSLFRCITSVALLARLVIV